MKNKFKILSWNIHKGKNIWMKPTLVEMKESLKKIDCDVIFLQEVQGRINDDDKSEELQWEILADLMWPHFSYGKNAITSQGHHGNAILSRYPLLSAHNLNLTLHPLEMRGLLHVQIAHPYWSKIDLMTTHINLLHQHRSQQIQMVSDYLKKSLSPGGAFILAGDFNDWRIQLSDPFTSHDIFAQEIFMSQHGQHAKTFPSFSPLLPLDRIYYRGWKSSQAQVLSSFPWNHLSDHLPVYGELEKIEKS